MAPRISALAAGAGLVTTIALCAPSVVADSGSGGAKQVAGQRLRGASQWGHDDYDHDHDDYHHNRYHDHDDYHHDGHNSGGHIGDWRDLLPHASAEAPEGRPDESASLVDTEWPFGRHHGHHGHHGWGHRHHGWGHRHHYGHHHHHRWYSLEALGRDISNSSNMENSEFWTAVFEDKGLSGAFAGGLSKMNAAARSSWEQDLVAALDWDDAAEREVEQEGEEAKQAIDNLAAAEDWDDQVEREAEQEAHEAKRDIEHVGDRIDRAWDNLAQASSGDVGDQVEHEAEQEANEAKQAVDNLAASPETQFWDEVFGDESSRHSLASWLLQMGDSKRSEWQQRVSLLATQQGGKAWQPSWDGALQKLAAAQSLSASRWGWGHHHHHHHHGRRWGGWGGHHGHRHHHHHGWFSLPEEEGTSKSEKADEGEGRRLNMV